MNDNDKEILDSYKQGKTPTSVIQNIQPSIKEIQKVQDEERYAIKAEILSDVLDAVALAVNSKRYDPVGVEIRSLTPPEMLKVICSYLNQKIQVYREKSK